MRQKTDNRNSRGFSLVELIVVIAIISFVVATFFPNFMAARQRSRDTQRKSDMDSIKQALELYKLDKNPPVYPTTGAFDASMCGQCWSSGGSCTGNIYMRRIPCDPGSVAPSPYLYEADPVDTLKYDLTTCLENFVDTDRDPTPAAACPGSNTSYTIHEP